LKRQRSNKQEESGPVSSSRATNFPTITFWIQPCSTLHASLKEEPAVNIADTEHTDKLVFFHDRNAPEVLETHVRCRF
jgi:hypothetical protein